MHLVNAYVYVLVCMLVSVFQILYVPRIVCYCFQKCAILENVPDHCVNDTICRLSCLLH